MSEDNKNVAGDSERTSILPQSGTQDAERTEVLPAHAPGNGDSADASHYTAGEQLMPSLARPWSASRALPLTTKPVTRPWRLASRQSSPHRRRPRGASAQPSPERPPPSSPSASARASSRMQPSSATARTSMSRATRMVSATRATPTRTGSRTAETSRIRMEAQAAANRGLVPVSSRALAASRGPEVVSNRGRVPSRAIQAAPARDLLRRAAEAPVAPAVAVRM